MKQYEAVIATLERLGGQATLAELNLEVMKIKDCEWKTKTPFASIRRIVQQRPEIFKVRPGLWALRSYQQRLGLVEYLPETEDTDVNFEQGHSYYQGILAELGNMRGYKTFIPNQDRNKTFVNRPLDDVRSLDELPAFSYDQFIHKVATVDVSWFNERKMPVRLYEVEHSTQFENSLSKFVELQDFNVGMFIVASEARKREYVDKIDLSAYRDVKNRVQFISYDVLVSVYENEYARSHLSHAF